MEGVSPAALIGIPWRIGVTSRTAGVDVEKTINFALECRVIKGCVFLFNHHSKGSLLIWNQSVPMMFSSFATIFPMIFPWFFHDPLIFSSFSQGFPICSHDLPMILFHDSCDFTIVFPMVFYGFPWFSHGFPMDFPGAFHPPHRRHGRPPCGRWSASRRSRRPRARPATRRPAADATDATGRWWIHGLIHGLPSITSGNGHRNYKLLFFRIFL